MTKREQALRDIANRVRADIATLFRDGYEVVVEYRTYQTAGAQYLPVQVTFTKKVTL